MIGCHQHNKDSLIENLINGNAYAVKGYNAFNDNKLNYAKVEDMHFFIRLENSADSIQFIGQNGIKRATLFNTSMGEYRFLESDSYIRAVVFNKLSTMYLNPVIRYDGITKPINFSTATVNVVLTLFYRFSLVACWFFYLYY